MKSITLSMVDSENLTIQDDDDKDLKEYTEELSSVLKSGNVTILETTSGSLILRPNKITSIFVEELDKEESPSVPVPTQEDVKSDGHVDTITDG